MDMTDEVATAIELKNPVSLLELFQVFSTYVGQAINPLSDDVREFRAAMASQLSQLRDEVVTQNTEIASLNVAFQLRQERLKDLETKVEGHQKVIGDMKSLVKTLKFIGATIGGSILLLIWGMITGQVQITMR